MYLCCVRCTQVPMMKHTFKPTDSGRRLLTQHQPGTFTAIRMPYKGGTCSAIALLPADSSTPLADVVSSLHLPSLLSSGPGTAWQEVEGPELQVFLPKFKIQSQTSLKGVLAGMGVTAAFAGGLANFTRLSDVPLFISDVLHTVSTHAPSNVQHVAVWLNDAGLFCTCPCSITVVA